MSVSDREPLRPAGASPAPRAFLWEAAAIVGLVVIAAVLRFWHLSSLPAGLHGDEGWAGIDARRILDQGWIGPYTTGALGQPSGPLYLTAAAVRLFGNSVFAVRAVPALLGVLTVPLLYVVLRRNLGVWTAIAASAFLAVMDWHVHFTRLGFPVGAWPLAVLLAVGALMEAVRSRDWRWWALAGAAGSLGLYVYNAHPVFLAIFCLYAACMLRRWSAAVAFAAALLIVALPMIRFAANPANGYREHSRSVSILNKPPWTGLSGADRVRRVTHLYLDYWDQLALHPRIDYTDGSGTIAIVPPALAALAVLGVLLGAVYRRSTPLVWFALLVLLLLPFAAVLTIDALARRTCANAPFVAMFAALGVVESLRMLAHRAASIRYPASAMLLALVAVCIYQNINGYFVTFAASAVNPWVFAREMADASRYMSGLPNGTHVYFYSGRWSGNYETRRYLAPGVEAEDRSSEFGHYSLSVAPSDAHPVFVLLNPYENRVGELRQRYPGGRLVKRFAPGGEVSFIAYEPF